MIFRFDLSIKIFQFNEISISYEFFEGLSLKYFIIQKIFYILKIVKKGKEERESEGKENRKRSRDRERDKDKETEGDKGRQISERKRQ